MINAKFEWTGLTSLATARNDIEGPTDVHVVRVSVDDSVTYEMRGVGGQIRGRVTSDNIAVRRHYHELEAERQRTAHRYGRVPSELSETPKKRRKPADDVPRDEIGRPMEKCPACDGHSAFCRVCDESGWVTQGQAEYWRDAHDDQPPLT